MNHNDLKLRTYNAPTTAITKILGNWVQLMDKVRLSIGNLPDGYNIVWAMSLRRFHWEDPSEPEQRKDCHWFGNTTVMLVYIASTTSGRDGVSVPVTEVPKLHLSDEGLTRWNRSSTAPTKRNFVTLEEFEIEKLCQAIKTGVLTETGLPTEYPLFRVNTSIALPFK